MLGQGVRPVKTLASTLKPAESIGTNNIFDTFFNGLRAVSAMLRMVTVREAQNSAGGRSYVGLAKRVAATGG
jgi:hypothetical protein